MLLFLYLYSCFPKQKLHVTVSHFKDECVCVALDLFHLFILSSCSPVSSMDQLPLLSDASRSVDEVCTRVRTIHLKNIFVLRGGKHVGLLLKNRSMCANSQNHLYKEPAWFLRKNENHAVTKEVGCTMAQK